MSRVLLDVVAQNFSGGICRFSKIRRRLKSRFFFPEQTAPNETGHQPLKDGSHRGCYLQRRRIKGSIWSHSHFPQSARQLRGGEIVKSAKRRLQFGVAANMRRHGPMHSVPRLSTDPAGAAAVPVLGDSLGSRCQAT